MKLKPEEIQALKAEIDEMSATEMGQRMLTSPIGDPLFDSRVPEVSGHFNKRLKALGGVPKLVVMQVGLKYARPEKA